MEETNNEIISQKKAPRIDRKYVTDQLLSFLNFEKGFFYTVKELTLRPGKTISGFIEGTNRNKVMKPLNFMFFSVVLYTFLDFIGLAPPGIYEGKKGLSYRLFKESGIEEFFMNNLTLQSIILAIFFSFWLKLFFIKNKYNVFEFYVISSFGFGLFLLLQSSLNTIQRFLNSDFSDFNALLNAIIPALYVAFTVKFNLKNLTISIIAYLLSIASLIVLIVLMGFLVYEIF